MTSGQRVRVFRDIADGKVNAYDATFLAYGSNKEELANCQYSYIIVETDDGPIEMISASSVQFLED